jgi:hypothetical protein
MKRPVIPFVLAAAATAAVASAQSPGTLTVKGVPMQVKSAVAVLGDDPSLTSVTVYLLSSAPSADQIAKLQAGDRMWLMDPFGRYTRHWSDRTAVGDAKKASIVIQTDDLGVKGSVIFKPSGGFDASLIGPVKEGQEVTLTSKGSGTLSDITLSWDFKVKAKVVSSKKT